jgi:lysozyme family protein
MARLIIKKESEGTFVRLLIDHSVGRHGRNRRDDVQLIQFLLNAANNYVGGHFFNPRPEDLHVDGVCGEKTLAAILLYQKNINSVWPNTLVEDGTVNATKKSEFRKGGHTFHTARRHCRTAAS